MESGRSTYRTPASVTRTKWRARTARLPRLGIGPCSPQRDAAARLSLPLYRSRAGTDVGLSAHCPGRKVGEHQSTTHRSAGVELRRPVFGSFPENPLELGHRLRIARRKHADPKCQCFIEGFDVGIDFCVEPVPLRPFGISPIGVDRHRAERTQSDFLLDRKPHDEGAESDGELAELDAGIFRCDRVIRCADYSHSSANCFPMNAGNDELRSPYHGED